MAIAIIGAGIAGAACASALIQAGHNIVIFDKGRSVGGRMSSKRTDQGYLDLGAQYFTARSAEFNQQCQHWLNQQVIDVWQGRLAVYQNSGLSESADDTVRYIGRPSMHKPVQHLLQNVDLRSHCRIDVAEFDGQRWQLYSQHQLMGRFETLVLALPQQQAAQLVAKMIPGQPLLAEVFAEQALLPCWAADIELDAPSTVAVDGIFVKNDPILSWVARQSSKAGRVAGEHWLLHFSPMFSQLHIDAATSQIAAVSQAQLQRILGHDLNGQVSLCHRWRYAQQVPEFPQYGHIYQSNLALGLCGDWLNGGRVENAWLSGQQLAQELSQ